MTARDGEQAFVSWDPPIYIIEVACARHRIVIRVLRALTVVAAFALAWFVGLTVGRF